MEDDQLGQEPGETRPRASPVQARSGYSAATLGGCIGGVLAAGIALLIALPFWPRGEDEAWAELGWAIFTLIACSIAGIAGGAVGILRALRRDSAPAAGLTAAVFVPTASLLLFGGPLVLAAPAAARWIALGLQQWWDARPARQRAAPRPARGAGGPQRIVIWVVGTVLGMTTAASMSNAALGGEVGGTAKVWLLCAVVPLVLVPLIWRALPPLALAAVVLGALLVGAAIARTSTAELHPSPGRLAQIARQLQPPAGQRVVGRTSALAARSTHRALAGDPQPAEIIESVPVGKERAALPPALTPDVGGFLPFQAPAARPDATPAAHAARLGWEQALHADGWVPEPPRSGRASRPMDWLPAPASEFLDHGGPVLARGLWQRAVVIPFGDGAIVVISTRP